MTLRENSSSSGQEMPPLHRKYSVSHSGRFKSRPKIRPSLSGDVFRPEPVTSGESLVDNFRSVQKVPSIDDIVVQRAVEHLDSIIGDTDEENPPQKTHQPHQRHPSSHAFQQQQQHKQSTREILETAL